MAETSPIGQYMTPGGPVSATKPQPGWIPLYPGHSYVSPGGGGVEISPSGKVTFVSREPLGAVGSITYEYGLAPLGRDQANWEAEQRRQRQLASESARLAALPKEEEISYTGLGEHKTAAETKGKKQIILAGERSDTYSDKYGNVYTGAEVSKMTYEQAKSEAKLGAELRAGGRLTSLSVPGSYIMQGPKRGTQEQVPGWQYEAAPVPKAAQPESLLDAGASLVGETTFEIPYEARAKAAYSGMDPFSKGVAHFSTALSPQSAGYFGSILGGGISALGAPIELKTTKRGVFYQTTYKPLAEFPKLKAPEEFVIANLADLAAYKEAYPKANALNVFIAGAGRSFESVPVQIEMAALTSMGIGKAAQFGVSALSKGGTALMNTRAAAFLAKNPMGFAVPKSVVTYGAQAVSAAPKLAGYGLGAYYVKTSMERAAALKEAGRPEEALGVGLGLVGELGAMQLAGIAQGKQEMINRLNNNVKSIKAERARVVAETKLKIAQEFAKTAQPEIKEISFAGMKRIPPQVRKSPQATIDYLAKLSKEGKSVLGGSTAMRAQLIEGTTPKGRFAESDLDFYINKQYQQAARDLAKIWKGQGAERVSVIGGKVTYAGQKAAEFHPFEMYARNVEMVQPWYKSVGGTIGKTPSGIRVQKLRVQAARKVVGGFIDPFQKGGRARAKDISDFTRIEANYAILGGPSKAIKLSQKRGFTGRVVEVSKIQGGFGETTVGTEKKAAIFIQKKLPGEIKAEIIARSKQLKDLIKPDRRGVIDFGEFQFSAPTTRRGILQQGRVIKRVVETPSREQTLGHEMLHQIFPKFKEPQVLRLEAEMVRGGVKGRGFAAAVEKGLGWKAPAAKAFKPAPAMDTGAPAAPAKGVGVGRYPSYPAAYKMPTFYSAYPKAMPKLSGYAIPKQPRPAYVYKPLPPEPMIPIPKIPKIVRKQPAMGFLPKYPRYKEVPKEPPIKIPLPPPIWITEQPKPRPPRPPHEFGQRFPNWEPKRRFLKRKFVMPVGKYGYTPSVGAMLFGITATRRPAVIGEIRPIIVPRGRRKPKPMWDISGFKKRR